MNENKSIIDIAQAAQGSQAQKQAPATTPTQEVNQGDVLSKLLEKVEEKIAWVPIDLPSQGLLSNGENKTVKIRPFTFEDEKMLRSLKKASQGNKVIESLIQRATKELNYHKLSLVDKTFILFKLRELSYGNNYEVEVECPQCSAKNGLMIELDKLPVVKLDPEVELDTKITLPDSEVEVEFRYPMAMDDAVLTDMENIMDNLFRFVKTIDGHDSRIIIQKFLTKTTGRDVLTLQKKIFGMDFGIQSKVNFICSECNKDSAIELPINESFFNVS